MKQRQPMKRGKPLRAKAKPMPARVDRSAEFASHKVQPVKASMCRVDDGKARLVVSLKEQALQHAGYMDLVRAMPCMHCGRPPRSQFCHSDAGKGTGIKTDCRRGWPGCGDDLRNNREGCHTLIGSRGTYTKAARRELEDRYATQTRAAILAAGTWPARLPRWADE